MKRIIYFLTAAIMIFSLAGCSTEKTSDDSTLKIVAAGFAEYDWVKEILGEKADDAELTYLLENGVDMHSFQPSVNDIMKISQCDLFIYTGGESDQWAQDAIKEADNKNLTAVSLIDVLGDSVKTEEIAEGMESEEAEEEPETDEHVWLSLKNAETLCSYITEKLSEIDSENAEIYRENNKAYLEKLSGLDRKYQETVNSSKRNVLLFADRFPFRYLTDDYGLDYYAAFPGCSAETQASFETVTFLAGKINELGLPAVITIDDSDNKIAETVINESAEKNQEILTMDSMQSINKEDIENGTDYLSVMEKNLETIKKALN